MEITDYELELIWSGITGGHLTDDQREKAVIAYKKIRGSIEALRIHDVVGQSEQFICRDCEKPSKEYRDQLCEPCHKWHTDS